jgi:hypothetical protein
MGELLGYRAMPNYRLGVGIEKWKDYWSWTDDRTLAELIRDGKEILREEVEVRERAKEKSQLRQVERELVAAQSEAQEVQQRVKELEAERAEWVAWKEAQIVFHAQDTAMRCYLHEHPEASIPIVRNGVTLRIVALGNDGVVISEDQGVLRLSDDELEQGRLWVAKKLGTPIIATRLPIGGESAEERSRLSQAEQELAAAQSEVQALRAELAKYLPPPRALLECSLRRWCALTNVFFQGKTLIGDELDTFLREASERWLLKFIDTAEQCYFIGKHRRLRIAIIQQHLKDAGEEWRYEGDRALVIASMDDQGTVIFANGDRQWMDTDGINHFWARIVGAAGQRTVGGNTSVVKLQQYLCDHPGECIQIQRGKDAYQIVLIDDDGLAIAQNQRLVRLYEDDIEQAQRWVMEQRHGSVVERS